MPSPTSPAPAAAPSSVKPSQCRPGTLAGELRIALLRTARRLRMERSSRQMTEAHYSVLAALLKYGPLTPGVLAEREHVQPPSMTRTVTALVAAGLRPPQVGVGRSCDQGFYVGYDAGKWIGCSRSRSGRGGHLENPDPGFVRAGRRSSWQADTDSVPSAHP